MKLSIQFKVPPIVSCLRCAQTVFVLAVKLRCLACRRGRVSRWNTNVRCFEVRSGKIRTPVESVDVFKWRPDSKTPQAT